MKTLEYALSRFVKRYFPKSKQLIHLSQHRWLKVPYLSVEKQGIVFPKENSMPDQMLGGEGHRRVYSEVHGSHLKESLERRSLHFRSNSDGMVNSWSSTGAMLTKALSDCTTPEWALEMRKNKLFPKTEQTEKSLEEDDSNSTLEEEDIFAGATRIQQSVQKFMHKNDKAQQRFDLLWTAQDDDILKQMDPSDTWFSLKDVMELILMQAKQIQLQDINHECVYNVLEILPVTHIILVEMKFMPLVTTLINPKFCSTNHRHWFSQELSML